MTETPVLLYLEADDEITAVVRRVRAADAARVVVVAPGRSRATSSGVALRLLVRAAQEDGRELAVVGDALTRSLAAEAGLAAYGSVEEARRALPAEPMTVEGRHAAIHVVRGGASDDTAPTMAAIAADTEVRPVAGPVPVARVTSGPRPAARARRATPKILALAAAVAAVLLAAGVAGAFLLPSATITIVPRSEPTPERTYEIVADDVERLTGRVESTATVTATGTYLVQAPATGTVTFRNFNIVPVEVPAETLVAAGEQAFATTAAIVVDGGGLTPDGRIRAGEASVDVVASAIGPAANVAADAIDTILDEQTRNRLRGFPQNDARLVLNPEPTSGGVDTTGPEITQADVDAAIEALRAELASMVEAEVPDADGDIIVRPAEAPAPVIEGTEELAGTRDQPEAEIAGSLAWETHRVSEAGVREAARSRFAEDPAARPADHELLPDATRVTIGDAALRDGEVVVVVTVVGRSAATPSADEIIDRSAGLGAEEAEAALAPLGSAVVDLWPGWTGSVPELDWRVEVRIVSEAS